MLNIQSHSHLDAVVGYNGEHEMFQPYYWTINRRAASLCVKYSGLDFKRGKRVSKAYKWTKDMFDQAKYRFSFITSSESIVWSDHFYISFTLPKEVPTVY